MSLPKNMRWEQDLVKDIRCHDSRDDIDRPGRFRALTRDAGAPFLVPPRIRKFTIPGGKAFSGADRAALLEQFLKVKDRCKFIMEIGVDCFGWEFSSTKVLLENKLPETVYLGVDVEPKDRLNNPDQNIHTICCPSQDYKQVRNKIQELNIQELDFFMIDGEHSINEVLAEWEYTDILSEHGVVAFHDTRYHSGPYLFVKNLDQTKWDVIPDAIDVKLHDYGLGFAKKKQ